MANEDDDSYCNSILQCLYYSKPFRENVVNFPMRGQASYVASYAADDEGSNDSGGGAGRPIIRVNTEPLPTTSASAQATAKLRSPLVNSATSNKEEEKEKKRNKNLPTSALIHVQQPPVLENVNSSDYKKKKALEVGPLLELDQGNNTAYGMDESLFTALKDLFESIMAHHSKTGIVKPNKFLEILRRGNDMFNGQQHQDAHEFLNYLLNEIIENVEEHQKKTLKNGTQTPASIASASSLTASSTSTQLPAAWIHDLFQGQLTSETKCLTCENVSRRDEHFLDLSIDLEKNSSVTSCLRNFSASEMLCERNKFHCDTCGGLQEAEKRMKIKRLPKVLALHLKRFKYMEETQRFEKLHYRVLYPYHLRLFNTTDDAEDPDKLYELYAVVVHIGGGPYHGHYVAIIKTEDKGWLLFDDELVEPVDKDFVRNFFGDRNGQAPATAYLLFYQETTVEAMEREIWADRDSAPTPTAAPVDTTESVETNGHARDSLQLPIEATTAPISHTHSSPFPPVPQTNPHLPPAALAAEHPPAISLPPPPKSKKERKKAEKAAAAASEESSGHGMGMSRFRNTSKSLRRLGGSEKKDKKDKPSKSEGKDLGPFVTAEEVHSMPTPQSLPLLPAKENGLTAPSTTSIATTTTNITTTTLGGNSNDGLLPASPSPQSPTPGPRRRESTVQFQVEANGVGINGNGVNGVGYKEELSGAGGKGDGKEKKKGLHKHRPSLWGLRGRAKAALGAGE